MTDASTRAFQPADADRSIAELTALYNELRQRDDQKPIKRWSKSKTELLETINSLNERLLRTLPADAVMGCEQEDPVDPQEQVGDETQGEPEDLTHQHLSHDDAIKFIRRHRRRRDIYVRIGTTVHHEDRRDFKSSDFLRVSAKQARSAVTLLIGKDSSYLGHTLELRIDPPSVPVGSKHKGKLFVG